METFFIFEVLYEVHEIIVPHRFLHNINEEISFPIVSYPDTWTDTISEEIFPELLTILLKKVRWVPYRLEPVYIGVRIRWPIKVVVSVTYIYDFLYFWFYRALKSIELFLI